MENAKFTSKSRAWLGVLAFLLLAGGTFLIVFSWRRLNQSDDAELAGWCVALGMGLSATAAFIAERILFPSKQIANPPLRFVVLRHEGIDDPHFDLMLETSPGSALATWRSPIWPIVQTSTLLQLADHRRDYLDYEGPVSRDRGTVQRVAAGSYRIIDVAEGGKLIEWLAVDISPIHLQKVGDSTGWQATPTGGHKTKAPRTS